MLEVAMRAGIHPEVKDASINCACGQVIATRSTAGSYSIDICSACHPFYTGKQKLVDAEGRVERFRRRYSKAAN
jgi:large subunit ribosomal protein L31